VCWANVEAITAASARGNESYLSQCTGWSEVFLWNNPAFRTLSDFFYQPSKSCPKEVTAVTLSFHQGC
jgi:hypothetical protein